MNKCSIVYFSPYSVIPKTHITVEKQYVVYKTLRRGLVYLNGMPLILLLIKSKTVGYCLYCLVHIFILSMFSLHQTSNISFIH